MKARLAWCVCLGALACPGRASELTEGEAALADRLPAVAEAKAREALQEDPKADGAHRLLAQALAMRGAAEAALAELDRLQELTPADLLLRAKLRAGRGDLENASRDFRAVLPTPRPDLQRAALLGEAGILSQQGRAPEAIVSLQRWLRKNRDVEVRLMLAQLLVEMGRAAEARPELARVQPRDPAQTSWKAYLMGRLDLLDANAGDAIDAFTSALLHARGMNRQIVQGAHLGIAQARLAENRPDEAAAHLEEFIREGGKLGDLAPLFNVLDRAYARLGKDIPRQLEKWARQDASPRTTYALYYLARAELRSGKPQRALERLEKFLEEAAADHPLRLEARLSQAELLAQFGQEDQALALIERALAENPPPASDVRLRLLAGSIRFRQRSFDAAAEFFAGAAARAGASGHEEALFDTALARLNAHDEAGFREAFRAYEEAFPASPLRSEVVFERGMLAARAGEPEAGAMLQRFAADYPRSRNAGRARLALAEAAALAGHPDQGREFLRVALASDDPEVKTKAMTLRIFQNAESSQPPAQAEALREGRVFLEEHPDSPLVPDVRMKMGELYFRSGDYGNARTQFEILARDHARSPYAEPALFLAGQAAARSMNAEQALELFEQVARGEGPFRWNARAEQARLKSQLGVPEEAIVLYDAVLKGEPDAELRLASLIGKAMSLGQLGEKQPERIAEAIAVFDQVIEEPDVTPSWRNEALYRKGKLLQTMQRDDDALAAFYDVVARTLSGPGETELFWFYRAGSEAARMLEQRGEFRGALSIYEKMAALEGPRSAEMNERKEKLQLEHFLWDEPPAATPAE